jgi:tetratricopeptide (TPR) repeat protein
MLEDFNPNPQSRPVSFSSEEELAQAFEDFVSNAPFRLSARQSVGPTVSSLSAGPCAEAGDWLLLAGGELAPTKGSALLTHAALCTGCLNRLRESQLVLTAETPSDELEGLKQFASTSVPWQRRLALQLAQTPHAKNRIGGFKQFVWIAGSLAALLVLAVAGLLWRNKENAPERLIALAYTQARIFDLRVPGAGFGPVAPKMHLRGSDTDSEPAPLLNARAGIERKLQQSPNDAHWLQMQARTEVLGERYGDAIDILDRLLAAGPVTSSLLLDDGMAYYLRGAATGSENDRATALDNLRRADELAPNDPVILFDEAIVMEDRGQMMNAVETWNRFVQFETDPKWRQEGRQRLQSLEEKLNRVKTHESRMEQHLATPLAMRMLAADPATLAGTDEELSTTFLPRLLDAAYPVPGDRSRGSPCDEQCLAARGLLAALAVSLQRNHQDSWLKEFLPSDPTHIPNEFPQAAHALGQSIEADTRGAYADAQTAALQGRDLFRTLGDIAGAERAEVERAYALQRSFQFSECQKGAERLLSLPHRPRLRENSAAGLETSPDQFTWIDAQAASLAAGCDLRAGASMNSPMFANAFRLSQLHHYLLLELRARTGMAGWAFQCGDNEDAWRLMLEAIRSFYAGDFPPFRAGTFMASLVTVEEDTPRVHLALLLNQEALSLFELGDNRPVIEDMRGHLIRAALRAGALDDARRQMKMAFEQTASAPGQSVPAGFRAEAELGLASVYLDRRDLTAAELQLDAAKDHLAQEDNWLQQAQYAGERGELELALGHPETAESILRRAIRTEELRARGAGPSNVVWARQDRSLYAALAGVWLAENRPGIEILALWERYRLRVLGSTPPTCGGARLDCLKTEVKGALVRDFSNRPDASRQLIGQIVLRDRTLLYFATSDEVTWRQDRITEPDLLSAVDSLDRVAASPDSSIASIDLAGRRVGDALLIDRLLQPKRALFIESDPLLGNLPWPCVETAQGAIGLDLPLEELPSLVLEKRMPQEAHGESLIVGASVAAEKNQLLPEALHEAQIVAADNVHADLLVGAEATEPHVTRGLSAAPLIHFAGHAERYQGQTRLLLAPAGGADDQPYLDASLLRRYPPRAARLIVFSACSTGKREDGWNHGMGDIVDTLTSLGAPEVVATRWQIDSGSAIPMMSAFYSGISKGMSVPQALTAARLSLIRDARYRRPYYWAAYYASGMGSTDLHEVFHGSSN